MKYLVLFLLGLILIAYSDFRGSRILNRNAVSQHAQFSSRADHRPNVWPFELFLSPAHKLP